VLTSNLADGENIAVVNGGKYGTSGGTSASTPISASIINRMNEMRLNDGKSPLGFLNPALYSNASIFNGITIGTDPGCGSVGFSAVPGQADEPQRWDPVTGLGLSFDWIVTGFH
jgi:tripeptidyl-peptidase-1